MGTAAIPASVSSKGPIQNPSDSDTLASISAACLPGSCTYEELRTPAIAGGGEKLSQGSGGPSKKSATLRTDREGAVRN